MSKYTFLEGAPGDAYKTVFERFLFNEERHRRSRSGNNWNTFSLVNEQALQIVAQIHFHILNGIAESPYRAPFGSMEFMEGLAPENLLSFLMETEKKLKSSGIKKIIVKDAPHQYRPQQSALLSALFLNSGFNLIKEEINSGIVVDDASWETKISHAELKRLRRSKQEDLEFRILREETVDEVYIFIQSCREERGMSLSMTLQQLKNTMQGCKGDFLLFGVFQKIEMIAASISVKVNQRILYDFYHAHAKSVDQLSPVVALINGMYSYCFENKFDLLDLGTSTLDKKINFSLLNFKEQIGGMPSLKLTFEKDLI